MNEGVDGRRQGGAAETSWLALVMAAIVALAGCAPAAPYATTAYCTPAGLRWPPTAALGGLVGSVKALPAAGVCRARSTQLETVPTPPPPGGAPPPAESPAPTK